VSCLYGNGREIQVVSRGIVEKVQALTEMVSRKGAKKDAKALRKTFAALRLGFASLREILAMQIEQDGEVAPHVRLVQ
jgi:hypothetical protein